MPLILWILLGIIVAFYAISWIVKEYRFNKKYKIVYIDAATLINEIGAKHGGVDGSIGGIIKGFSETTHLLVTCKDGTVHEVPNGKWITVER